MSYCRWIEGDVYVFHLSGTEDDIVCMCCALGKTPALQNDDFVANGKAAMVQHLNEHVASGDHVGWAIERLNAEIEEERLANGEGQSSVQKEPTE